MLRLFEGYVDIYLPDIKYSDNGNASKYSGVKDYVEYNRLAITEMFRQVGKRGVIVRHLVLPSDIAGSYQSLKFLASLSKDIWISVMSQYHPCYKAIGHPVVGRKITAHEYNKVIDWIEDFGFENVLVQEMKSSDIFLPDFKRPDPFES
jgi:putative pyruvate formate lyase activating enzyme